MANTPTGQSNFGFLSNAEYGMEERSSTVEGAPLFGLDSKDVGNLGTDKGSHAVAATPLNAAPPGGMRWSPGAFADGIIAVSGKEGKGLAPASYHGPAGGSGCANDTMIGLELGKRTYFEVPGGGGGGGGQAPSQAQAKKPRIAGQTPKCQVEGCKTDLTSAKDYHRRHKVCAIHSKAARVIVDGQEQRFCQQCSRFHGLTEFDEGKRSCRRRLAGHNQRRRKPQPDTLGLHARFLPQFQDSRRLGHLYTDRTSFPPHVRIPGVSALWDEYNDLNPSQRKGAWPPRMLKYEDQSSFECSLPAGAGMERQLFLTGLQHPNDRGSLFLPQSPKGMIPVSNDVSGPKTHQYFQGSVGPLGQSGQSLSLTSSSGAGVLSGLEAIPVGQGFTRVSDSGRALSLQSTMQLWSSTQASVAESLDSMTTHSNTMSDHGLHNSHIPIAQPLMQVGQQHHFEWANDKLLSAASSLHSMSSATPGYPTGGSNTIEKDHLEGPFTHGLNGVGNYECLPFYSMLQGGDMPQDVKPTIDLMQVASAPHGQSTQPLVSSGSFDMGSSHFGDLQALRSYESSIFSSQQM